MKRALIAGVLGGGLAAAFFAAVPPGPYAWYVSRVSGLIAFTALTGSVMLGLLISSRRSPRWLPKVGLFEMHQFLAVLGLSLVGVHAAALLFDDAFHFAVTDLLLPFAAPYRPGWLAAGIVAAWLSAAIAASFWLKKWIGQRSWRLLHSGSFLAYVLALLHGIGAGTDSRAAPVYWMYVSSAALVVSLTTFRVLSTRVVRARSRPPARRPDALPADAAARVSASS
jgi:predicted ferric reductase